jgi:hypothetical protein
MNYYDDEYDDLYDYDTLANNIDDIDDEYFDDDDDYLDDGIEAWENYYHNIASEIEDD